MRYKDGFSRFLEMSQDELSNLKSGVLDTYERGRKNISENKNEIFDWLKKAGVAGLSGVIIATGGPSALAEDNDKKVNVPIGQVTQSKEDCQLSSNQLTKEEVEVLKKCVNEEYLNEIGYEQSSEEGEAPKGFEEERIPIYKNTDEFQITEFGDDDSDMEGIFVDNQIEPKLLGKNGRDYVKRTNVALYPVDFDGKTYNTITEIPKSQAVEARAGDLDGDGDDEFAVFYNTDGNGGVLTFNRKGDSVNKDNYSIDKEITDGDIVNGNILVSINEDIREGGIYVSDGDEWGKYLSEEDIGKVSEKLNNNSTPSSYIAENILIEDIDSDKKDELLAYGNGNFLYLNDNNVNNVRFIPFHGRYEDVEDLQYANYNPWEDKEDEIIVTPSLKAQSSNSVHPIYAFSSPFGNGAVVSYISESDKKVTDSGMFPYRDRLSKEAKKAEGSMDWLKKWMDEFNLRLPERPLIISSTDGLWMDNGRDMTDPSLYDKDFGYKDVEKYTQDADLETFNLNNKS